MNVMEFIAKVREMREAQVKYFHFRCSASCREAKALEREVDAALEEGVTVYATCTLENMKGVPAEGERLGTFVEPDRSGMG